MQRAGLCRELTRGICCTGLILFFSCRISTKLYNFGEWKSQTSSGFDAVKREERRVKKADSYRFYMFLITTPDTNHVLCVGSITFCSSWPLSFFLFSLINYNELTLRQTYTHRTRADVPTHIQTYTRKSKKKRSTKEKVSKMKKKTKKNSTPRGCASHFSFQL